MKTHNVKKVLAAAIIATIIGSAGAVMAAPGNTPTRGYHHGQRTPLTQEQENTITKAMQEYAVSTDTTQQQLTVKTAELRAQMNSVKPDASRIEAISKEIGALRGSLLAAKVTMAAQLEKNGIPKEYTSMMGMHGGRGMMHGGRGMGGMMHGGCGMGGMMSGMERDYGVSSPATE